MNNNKSYKIILEVQRNWNSVQSATLRHNIRSFSQPTQLSMRTGLSFLLTLSGLFQFTMGWGLSSFRVFPIKHLADPMESTARRIVVCYATTATQTLAHKWKRVYFPLPSNDSAQPEHVTIWYYILTRLFVLGNVICAIAKTYKCYMCVFILP
jgi:hypothetical protein